MDRRRLRRAAGRSRRVPRHEVLTLLLDTHVVLWWMTGDVKRVSQRVAEAIQTDGAGIVVSAVTVWEIAIKRRLGKLKAPDDLLDRLERADVDLLSIAARHADRVARLPDHHRDPFDRLLVAQAMVEGMALASADELLRGYDVELVW